MSKILETVNQRTQLVGQNRLELLMFHLNGRQLFALNVFKIQEVVRLPVITELPHRHEVVRGVAHMRDKTIPVIDLNAAVYGRPLRDLESANMIVTEYNRSVQAFLVGPVERIVNLNWEDVLPPPTGTGRQHYLTAITRIDEQIIEILDVERVLADIMPYDTSVSPELLDEDLAGRARASKIKLLMADDSNTAITQVRATLQNLGVEVIGVQDGLQALELMKGWINKGINVKEHILMLITDAEMPEMDGYRLTYEVRQNPALSDLFVVLHTSLSGSFNSAMVEKVGCDGFMSKFQPDELAKLVQERVRKHFTQIDSE